MALEVFRKLARIGTPLALLAIVVLSSVPGSERPHTGLAGQIEHLVAYALTAAGILVGYPHRRTATLATLIILAAVLEIGQNWIPGRMPQLIDFIASTGGALLGAVVGEFANRWAGRLFGCRPVASAR